MSVEPSGGGVDDGKNPDLPLFPWNSTAKMPLVEGAASNGGESTLPCWNALPVQPTDDQRLKTQHNKACQLD